MATLVGSTGLVAGRARATDRVGTGPPMAGGIQIARFSTTPGGHLGDQVANHIGGSARIIVPDILPCCCVSGQSRRGR